MKRNFVSFFAVSALFAGSSVIGAERAPDMAANLPGIRYCPAPGCDNDEFLDTYFSVDARTGKLTVHRGAGNAADESLPAAGEEVVLFAAPNGNRENRFVPPERTFASTGAYAAYNPAPHLEPYPEQQSESLKGGERQITANDEKIPWWKGGMWRNRKGKDGDGKSSSSSSSSGSSSGGSSSRSSGSSSSGSSRFDDEDMWDDDEYSGYNPDGSFGRSQSSNRDLENSSGQRAGRGSAADNDPFSDPFASPYDDGGNGRNGGYAGSGPGGGGAARDQVNYAGGDISRPPAQQYDPYAPVDTSGYGVGSTYSPPPPAAAYDDLGTGNFLDSSSYGAPAGYGGSPGYGDPYGAPQSDPFASAPPSYQAEPSIDAQGSPQFENAVRLVKENRFSEAKSILTSETSRNPSNSSAWRWLADCEYNLLELDGAINSYQRALELDPNSYYALRGQGFAYLHRGHEYWRQMQQLVSRGEKEAAAETFARAHESYKKSLERLGLCLRRSPDDGEAVYGEAMAAEGASRKLYSNAISYIKLGPSQRERAELFAENCLNVINKGIERSKERAKQSPGDAGPRALLGGLYLRKAILYHQLGKNDLALVELRNSRDVQRSILDEIDKNNATAQKNLRECEMYWEQWGGNRQ